MADSVEALESGELTLAHYAAALWRRRLLVILPVIVVTTVALALTLSQPKQYRSSTEVLVKEPPSASAIGAPERPMQQRVLQNELQRAQGSEIQREVRSIVGPEPEISVKLAASEDVDVFVFSGESNSAQDAAMAANAYAEVYIEQRRESITVDLAAQAAVLAEQLEDTATQIDEATTDDQRAALDLQRESYEFQLDQLTTSISLAEQSGASIIDAATPAGAPFAPRPIRAALLALAFGLMLGIAAALAVDFFDHSLRDEDDLARTAGRPVLGVIPKLKNWKASSTRLVTVEDPTSPTSEAYRALRTAVQYSVFENNLKIVQVTSAKPGDGKTTTSANLAVVAARADQRVLLIDCDLRRPRVHQFFGLNNSLGFTTLMVGGTIDEVVHKVDGEPNLSVIGSGPLLPDPSELLASTTAQRAIDATRERFDLIIIDSPPILAVADPLVISSSADGVVLVTSAMQSDRRDVSRAMDQLAQLDARVMGVVLNSFDAASSHSYRHDYGVYESRANA